MRDETQCALPIPCHILDWLVWSGAVLNPEALPVNTRVVFLSNHVAAQGPVMVPVSLPVRVDPLVPGDMMDRNKAAKSLRKYFVEPRKRVPSTMSRGVSRLIPHASLRRLRAIECIPV